MKSQVSGTVLRRWLVAGSLGLLLACGGKDAGPPQALIPLEPFIQLASAVHCNEVRNRLYLIDQRLVLWDRRGNCGDASFAQILYADSPQTVLCKRNDSVVGTQVSYLDPQYKDLFDTAVANLDHPGLGLTPAHVVTPIAFWAER